MNIPANPAESPLVLQKRRTRVEPGTPFRFNDRTLHSLQIPKSRRVYYRDSVTRGLTLIILPTSVKSFYLYRRIQGRPERVLIGRFPDLTVEQARLEAAKFNGLVAQGVNPNDERRKLRAESTLQSLWEKYRDNTALRPKTLAGFNSIWKCHLSGWADRKISNIMHDDVERLHKRIGKEKPYVANRVAELLHAMFAYAIGKGWGGQNPAKGIDPYKERKRKRYMQAGELRYFFAALAQETNTTVRDLFALALLTGARRANLQAAEWKEIDFERALWVIPPEKAKADEPIEIPLVDKAIELLRQRKAEQQLQAERARLLPDKQKARIDTRWVFPSTESKTGHVTEVKSAWSRVTKRAGELERQEWEKRNPTKAKKAFEGHDFASLRFHDARRTFASWQARLGASLLIIGASLGHEPGSPATAIYSQIADDPVRDSVNRATAAILQAGDATALLGTGN
jgi:integrase